MSRKWTTIVTGLALLVTGCNEDEELARMTRESLSAQREQNRMMHAQNEQLIETTREVTRQGRELAEASKQLVDQDAQARRELVSAHQSMRTELQQERLGLDRQRDRLEADQRTLAAQRRSDPVIAEAIHTAALWLACLAPLALAAYVLVAAHRGDERAALDELLVLDLASQCPRLLPSADGQALLNAPSCEALPGPETDEGPKDADT